MIVQYNYGKIIEHNTKTSEFLYIVIQVTKFLIEHLAGNIDTEHTGSC